MTREEAREIVWAIRDYVEDIVGGRQHPYIDRTQEKLVEAIFMAAGDRDYNE